MHSASRMVEQSARRYCSYCSRNVQAVRRVPADSAIDPFVVLGTLGLALLFRKSGLESQLEPFRCPECGKPVAAPEHPAPHPSRSTSEKSAGEYVDALRQLGSGARDAYRKYTQDVRFGILLYYGVPVTSQVDKLVSAGNVDRACKLLAVARPYRWPRAQRILKVLVVPLVLDLVAAGFVVVGAVRIADTSNSSEWPTAEGTVLSSGIDTVRSDDGVEYRAVARYRYQVDETIHEGDRVSFDWSATELEQAQEMVNRLPVDGMVTVYYKRDNPQYAVLVPGISMTGALFVAVGMMMMLSTGVTIVLLLRKPLAELRQINGHRRPS